VERSWGVLGEGGGSRSRYNSGYHGPGFSGGLPLVDEDDPHIGPKHVVVIILL